VVRDDDLNELYKVLQPSDSLIYRSDLFFKLAEAGEGDVNVLLRKINPAIETKHGGQQASWNMHHVMKHSE